MNKSNIVETAVSAGSFGTLVAAVKAAGLVDVLSSTGPFTVFAPNDEAFAKLPKGTIEGLLKDIPALRSILTYHVVSGKVSSADVAKITSDGQTPAVSTLQGSQIKLRANNGSSKMLQVNDADIISSDIDATNGVIHVIDKVLIPQV